METGIRGDILYNTSTSGDGFPAFCREMGKICMKIYIPGQDDGDSPDKEEVLHGNHTQPTALSTASREEPGKNKGDDSDRKEGKTIMKRFLTLILCLTMAAVMTGCSASADQRTGEAQGYGGTLRVTVTMNGSDITNVTVTEHNETEGVGTRAIDALPEAIANADSVEVDIVSGATVTSNAIKEAVRNAMGLPGLVQETIPAPGTGAAMATLEGVGMAATGRVGPGTDSDGKQVYSFNVVFAHGSFDPDGTIRSMKVDQVEVSSPNLGGGNLFSGFPEDKADEDAFMKEISAWTTKGAKGDAYMLSGGSWREQMNAYEQQFVGKTFDEVQSWFEKYFDEETGRPLTSGAAYDALSDADRKIAADITSSATISLRDEHGDILTAIQRAWEDAQRNTEESAPQNSAAPEGEDATEGNRPSEEGELVDTNTQTDMENETAG